MRYKDKSILSITIEYDVGLLDIFQCINLSQLPLGLLCPHLHKTEKNKNGKGCFKKMAVRPFIAKTTLVWEHPSNVGGF